MPVSRRFTALPRGIAALLFLSVVFGPVFAPDPVRRQGHAVGVDVQQLSDPALENRARAQFKRYRCPVCQNQSIEDSDAELAADLRRLIREQVQAGKSAAQVQDYLVARYGDWVLLRPRATGLTLWLWLFPLFLLLSGVILALVLWLRHDRKTGFNPLPLAETPTGPAPNMSGGEEEPLNEEERRLLKAYRQS